MVHEGPGGSEGLRMLVWPTLFLGRMTLVAQTGKQLMLKRIMLATRGTLTGFGKMAVA